jgi:hypothetical protein
MSSAQIERRFPVESRRITITDAREIPSNVCSTPGGTLFGTTPGGTKIVYDRSLLMKLSCSPMTKSPPSNMKLIPGVTSVGIAPMPLAQDNRSRVNSKKTETDEQLFEMEF